MHRSSSGKYNRGFEGNRTVSFSLKSSSIHAPNEIKVSSKAFWPQRVNGSHVHRLQLEVKVLYDLESEGKLWLIASDIDLHCLLCAYGCSKIYIDFLCLKIIVPINSVKDYNLKTQNLGMSSFKGLVMHTVS